ncbi:TnpV protein [Paenibacillus donghaensis]|uniref:TnpV protein n=1 Tax=Paenibacillus donghaensis TaxID=414771 RepID=A0A2Z2KLM7_9BACL|nr:TnpV protein [Paenibacillus donghaensis]ASA23389.1 TnpV protein [Paenibacillus donghaensis]
MNKKEHPSLTYHEIDGLLYPDLQISGNPEANQQPLGKYGRMALNHLRNHHPQRFLILQMQGDLMEKIHQVEKEALERLEQLSEQLLRLQPMPQTEDTLVRTRHLNQIKSTAEELVLNEIVLRPR